MNKAPLFQKRSSILTPNKRPVNGGGWGGTFTELCVCVCYWEITLIDVATE